MTLSTSDTRWIRTMKVYGIVSALVLIFSIVYELFSHGVYALPMMFAFMYPFFGGVAAIGLSHALHLAYPNRITRNAYHAAIATLTIGSLMQGVLDIYGTTNALQVWYTRIGIFWILIALLFYGIQYQVRK